MWDGSSTPHHSDAPRQLDAHHAADDGPAVDAHERLRHGEVGQSARGRPPLVNSLGKRGSSAGHGTATP